MGRKVLHGLGVLWGTLTLVFMLFAMAPDPARQLAGQNESEEIVAAIRTKLGLDRPLHVRYADFLTGFVPVTVDDAGVAWSGLDLGKSYVSDRPVVDAIADALPRRYSRIDCDGPCDGLGAVRWVWSRDDSGQRLGSLGAGICRAGDECAFVCHGHCGLVAFRLGLAPLDGVAHDRWPMGSPSF